MQVGQQGMADRYTYLPMIGLYVALIWSVSDLHAWLTASWPRWPVRLLTGLGFAAVLVLLSVRTVVRAQSWRDTQTLFGEAVRENPNNALVALVFAANLVTDGHVDAAVQVYRETTLRHPRMLRAHLELADTLFSLGRPTEAAESFRAALRLAPEDAAVHVELGTALFATGRIEESVVDCERPCASTRARARHS